MPRFTCSDANAKVRALGAVLALLVCLRTSRAAPPGPGDQMLSAATNLLATLSPEQKAKAVYQFDHAERVNWHFIPRDRQGLPLKEMSSGQRHLAIALLSTGLSQRGLLQATTIMSLEEVLKELEQGKGPVRDPERYFVTFFGPPSATGTWGWRFEGHHMSLNFTLVDGTKIVGTPAFFGSNPGEIREGPRAGLRVLGRVEDLGRQLVKMLTDDQRVKAIVATNAPNDIITGTNRVLRTLEPMGLAMADMTAAQKEVLEELLHEFVFWHRPELARLDLQKIEKAGMGKIHFAWAGGTEPHQPHYYRLQGPTFIMEYDNTQNNANHIHSVWRDLANDFGDDLLREHYKNTPHQ